MYKISEFSNLSGVSTKTLRYYDEINLFSPEYKDQDSGYRYYTESQIGIIKEILRLKQTGLSIGEIKSYLESHNNLILNKKKESYELKMNKIDEIDKYSDSNYNIEESTYDKYIEINGTKAASYGLGEKLKVGKAKYYIINKDNVFYDDFGIFIDEDNWITLNHKYFSDLKLVDILIEFLGKKGYKYFVFYLSDGDKMYSIVKENLNVTNEELVTQDKWLYRKIKVGL